MIIQCIMDGMKKFCGKCKDDWPNEKVNVDAVAKDKFHPIYLLSSAVFGFFFSGLP